VLPTKYFVHLNPFLDFKSKVKVFHEDATAFVEIRIFPWDQITEISREFDVVGLRINLCLLS
jgi:hypothetical protein